MYEDDELSLMFKGDHACGIRTSAIKGHPFSFEISASNTIHVYDSKIKKKCRKGSVNEFKRFIFIARDPFRSIFADFQRGVTGKHAGTLSRQINITKFAQFALSESIARSLQWENVITPLKKRFAPIDMLFLRYEDLIHSELKYDVLKSLMDFMHFEVTHDRIECAFFLADKPVIHRKAKTNITLVYEMAELHNENLICRMWDKLKIFSSNFSYSIWDSKHCTR
jgi:hypothetical protein